MMSGDPPGVIFLEFFRLINGNDNGNTRPPTLCAGEALDEKLKINELGPNIVVSGLPSNVHFTFWLREAFIAWCDSCLRFADSFH